MRYIISGILLFISTLGNAQFAIQTSETFKAPVKDNYDKVLLLKSGKTCYVHIDEEEGIKIRIYDNDRRLVATSGIASRYWLLKKLGSMSVCALMEVSGDIVMFMGHSNGDIYRMIISAADGKVIKEDIAGKVKSENAFYGNSCHQENVNIVMDPDSDNYAVITHDTEEDSVRDGIYVVHFNGRHERISASFIPTPGKKSHNFLTLDAVVASDKAVYIATAFTGDKQVASNVTVHSCKPGGVQSNVIAAITDADRDVTGRLVYDASSGNLVLAVAPLTDIQRLKMIYTYHVYLCYINAETLKPTIVNTVTDEKLNSFAKSEHESVTDFKGVPVDLLVKDNKVILVKEVYQYTYYTNAKTGAAYVSYTRLGDIGVSEFDWSGNETAGFIMPHACGASGEVPVMYGKKIARGVWASPNKLIGMKYTGEYPFVFIVHNTKRYLVFNAPSKIIYNPDHAELKEEDYGAGKWSASVNILQKGDFERKFLAAGNSNKIILTGSADHDKDGQFAAIEVSGNGDDKTAKVVWTKLE